MLLTLRLTQEAAGTAGLLQRIGDQPGEAGPPSTWVTPTWNSASKATGRGGQGA